MLNYRNNSDTLIIVLHEIYGINEHIAKVYQKLADSGYDVVCPDLLDGKPFFDYAREEEAYRYFMNFIGFESAAKRVTFLLRQEEGRYKRIFLLGFSVGATIAWLCGVDSVKKDEGFHYGGSLAKCSGIICIYGSRIREYMEVSLKCPALLIFAEEERSFDPYELQIQMEKMGGGEVHILQGKHGFADPYSPNYLELSAREAERLIKAFTERIK
jgi:dienelactone hydrolase